MQPLLDRFLRYVKIDTQADEISNTYPSTEKQLTLCRLLKQECEEMGLLEVEMNEQGIVTATVPATGGCEAPTIAFFAHVDTSPEFTAENVNPIVHENYNGEDIVLPNAPQRVLKVTEHPELAAKAGETVITTDGTTLLGADDKAGIAIMMSAAERLLSGVDFAHGPVKLCFTCDEEIGHGTDYINLEQLGAVCGYTLDGDSFGKIDSETFSADLAVVTVKGVNTHPSIGKGTMVNAVRYLSEFLTKLPTDNDAPEVTDGREGFMHPYQIEGGVSEASVRIILRDFETKKLQQYAALLRQIAEEITTAEPRLSIEVQIIEQYRNMREGMEKEPRAIPLAVAATKAAGVKPRLSIIRGGTDGSILTEKGLPTPNLSSGQHNPHSPLEWASLEEMQTASEVVMNLVKLWGEER